MSKRLIVILLMALWLPFGSHAATPVAGDVLTACPAVEHPQWSDVGLCDILAVTGGSTLAPPTPVRVLQDTPSGTAAVIGLAAVRRFGMARVATHSRLHAVSGYIYLIRCLRL